MIHYTYWMIPRKDRKTKQRGQAQAIYTEFALSPGSRPAFCVWQRLKGRPRSGKVYGGRGIARGGLVCSGWCGQAGGKLTRSRHPVWLVRVYFWLSWAGPKLEQGKNRGNCPFRTDFYRTYFSDSLDHSLDTAVWLPVSLTFGEPAGILGCSTDDGWFPEPAVQTVAQSSVWIRSAAPVHLDVQSVTTRWPSLTCNSHSLIESHLLPTGCHKESFVRE